MYGPSSSGADILAQELAGGLDAQQLLELIGDRLESAPELLVVARLVEKACALVGQMRDRVEELEGEVYDLGRQPDHREIVHHLHVERDHSGYFLTCDACCDDADLFVLLTAS